MSMDLIDPFKGDSILSFFPDTFGRSKQVADCKDVESIHNFMTARALQNADKYKEEARAVKDGITELPNIKENVNPQEKRPALVRKRAKFSMKPSSSDPSTNLEPTLQLDQIHDPVEFFAAHERHENAKKEIRRQRGEDLNENDVSTTTVRQRRPELPRKKATYKHREYSSQPESHTSSAQETLPEDIGSQPTFYPQQESAIASDESQEEEIAGSGSEQEDRVFGLWSHLMSTYNNDNLDDEYKLAHTQEVLNAKPPEITKLNLPDFHSIPRVDFASPVRRTSLNQRRLSDTRLSLDNSRGKTPAIHVQLSDNLFSPLGSPTPPKSPFCAISSLGKHKSKLSEGKDPFSLHDIDPSHTGTSETHSGQSTHTRKYKEISFGLGLLVDDEVTETAINDVMHTASAEGLSNPPDSGNLSEQCHNMEETEEDGNIGADCAATSINENGGLQGNAEEVEKAASGAKINFNFEDITDNGHPRSVHEMGETVEDVSEKAVPSTSPEADVEISTIEDLNTHCFQSVQIEDNIIEDLNESRSTQNTVIVSEQQNEEQPKKSANERKKTTRARKVVVRKTRQILAAQTDADIIEDLDESRPAQNLDVVSEQQNEVEDVSEKAVPSTSPEVDVEISTIGGLDTHCFQSVQAEDNIIEDLDESRSAQNIDIVSEQQNEEQPKKSSNKRKKTTRARKVAVKKTRQSLAVQTCADITEDLDESRPAQNLDVVSEQPNEEQPKTSANKGNKTTRAPGVNLRKTRQNLAAQTDGNVIENPDESRPAQIPDIVSEQQNEEQPKTYVDKRKTTTRASKFGLKKSRQSLAGAGSSWTDGVRKSSRIKRRPLEYWKGERLLYGRVHNSLPTIIGVKYISPAKQNGKPACFKVESFVSDKYKDLVDLTSLH